jgi:hypothetical protein
VTGGYLRVADRAAAHQVAHAADAPAPVPRGGPDARSPVAGPATRPGYAASPPDPAGTWPAHPPPGASPAPSTLPPVWELP